jgi:hypothetical protein
MTDFDTLRSKYPHLGFAAYALEPGGPVTLECLTKEGRSFQFTGSTLTAAIAAGFAEETEPDPQPEESATSVFD